MLSNIKENQVNEILKSLDTFIQQCLNKYKFVEVKKELYDNTIKDTNLIISHKSTIPDLVIWNKPFNKNDCFVNIKDNNNYNSFPRSAFYLRVNNNEDINKNKKKENIHPYDNLVNLVDKMNINKKEANKDININNKDYNINISKDKIPCEENNKELNEIIYNNINKAPEYRYMFKALIQNRINNNNYISPSINKKKTMNDYYQNQFKENELLMNYVYSFLDKKGWIIFKEDCDYISNFTSFELFSFLTSILKNNYDLKKYIIGMQTDSLLFNGEQIYIILSQTLPIILQKKQLELKQNEIMRKKRKVMNDKDKENIDNNFNNNNNNNISKNNDKNINKNNNNDNNNNRPVINFIINSEKNK